MVLGAGLIYWRTAATWSLLLLAGFGILFLLALLAPKLYAPIGALFRGLEKGMLRLFTWSLLAVIFALVFVPAGLVQRLRGRSAFSRRKSMDTYWRDCRSEPVAEAFGRQF
jgi:hypothetical protein